MELRDKRVAILAENHYEDLELWYPMLRLREAGAEVTVVGAGAPTYTSKHGYPVAADTSADRANAADFDAIIIPGGYAPDYMRRHAAMVHLVREAVHQGKIVAAICHAGWMLASANVLRDKRVTGFFSIKDDLINAGGLYEDSAVVRDENLITSRMPDDLPEFSRAIIDALAETKDWVTPAMHRLIPD
jgi:protease I